MLLIVPPGAIEHCPFAEVVCPSALLLPLVEVTHVFILVYELEGALSLREVLYKLTGIGAAISVDHPTSSVLAVILEAADIVVLGELVEVVSVALSRTVAPLPFVQFLLRVVHSVTVFEVVLPSARCSGDELS